jgi:hypothetical protein
MAKAYDSVGPKVYLHEELGSRLSVEAVRGNIAALLLGLPLGQDHDFQTAALEPPLRLGETGLNYTYMSGRARLGRVANPEYRLQTAAQIRVEPVVAATLQPQLEASDDPVRDHLLVRTWFAPLALAHSYYDAKETLIEPEDLRNVIRPFQVDVGHGNKTFGNLGGRLVCSFVMYDRTGQVREYDEARVDPMVVAASNLAYDAMAALAVRSA